MLIEFDTDLDVAGTTRLVREIEVVPAQRTTVSERCAYKAKDESTWTWEDLRDYVVHEIEVRYGPFPRDPRKESAIFKRYASEWPMAPQIARFAFEIEDGRWKGAPISINRFCRGSDEWFSAPIAKRIAEVGWR